MAETVLINREVVKRDGTIIIAENLSRRKPDGLDSFDSGNAGMTLSLIKLLCLKVITLLMILPEHILD